MEKPADRMTDWSLPRGLRDYEPEDYDILEQIRSAFVETVKIYDFKLMEPSTIELLQVLEAKSGPDIRKEIYYFKDKAGREVGLRFDLTVGVTRYYCSRKDLPKLQKFAVFADVWRYEEPQKGRFRWFYQWDIEILGPKSPMADVEVVMFTHDLLRRLKLNNYYFIINDRRLTERAIIEKFGETSKKLIEEVFRALDKLDKKSKNSILEEYAQKGINPELLDELIAEMQSIRSKLEKSRDLTDIPEELQTIMDILKSEHVPFIIDPLLARGLDYYTSFVFEVKDEIASDIGSLVGGGRYDVLPAIYGKPDSGATGAAGGVDRIIEALKRRRIEKPELRATVKIVYTPEAFTYAFKVAHKLREHDIQVAVDIRDSPTTLRRAFFQALKSRPKIIVIVGTREESRKTARIKIVEKKEEKEVVLDSLADEIRAILERSQ